VSTVGNRADVFLGLMEQMDHFTLGRAWRNLNDDEFFWEPTPNTWSARRREDCRTPSPFGAGAWIADFGPESSPVPMTSIAWLAWHIGSLPSRFVDIDFLGGDRTIASGWTSPYLTHHTIFTSAARAAETFREGWAAWRAAIAAASDDELQRSSPDYTYAHVPMTDGICVVGPPGVDRPATFFIARALNEVAHHSAQICILRDLYAHSRGDISS
jgi:hypothetical protein